MEIISIKQNKISNNELDFIVRYFKQGKIIAYPTDTIYGLGCRANKKRAIDRIYKIKRKKADVPMIVLVSSISMIKKYCFLSRGQEEMIKRATGPTTFILKSRGILPNEVSGGRDSLAVRLPKNDFLIKMIKQVGRPIISTSLNISGKKNINDLSKVNKYFHTVKPDLVIDAGPVKRKQASRVVDIRDLNNIKVLRK
jgi:tRNA threonylcarbamoyl adenosine modification protein (Sua5/YciO/YrdC/YwlC family)